MICLLFLWCFVNVYVYVNIEVNLSGLTIYFIRLCEGGELLDRILAK